MSPGEKRRRALKREQQQAQEMADYDEREALFRRQDTCTHYRCEVTEWNWSGKPREICCTDCGKTKYIEDEED